MNKSPLFNFCGFRMVQMSSVTLTFPCCTWPATQWVLQLCEGAHLWPARWQCKSMQQDGAKAKKLNISPSYRQLPSNSFQRIPSRKLTYPISNLGKGKSSSKLPLGKGYLSFFEGYFFRWNRDRKDSWGFTWSGPPHCRYLQLQLKEAFIARILSTSSLPMRSLQEASCVISRPTWSFDVILANSVGCVFTGQFLAWRYVW